MTPARIAAIFGLGALLWAGEAAAGCPKGESAVTHEVQSGDTLSAIALKNGTTMRSIERQNPGLERDSLKIGQKLRFCVVDAAPPEKASAKAKDDAPAKDDPKASKAAKGDKPAKPEKPKKPEKCGKDRVITSYEVRAGDFLSSIAERHGVDEADLITRNPALRKRKNDLKIGETLEICIEEKRLNADAACGFRTPVFLHEVVPGDNPSTIAGRYGVRRADLYKLNRGLEAKARSLQNGSKIRVCPEIAPRLREKVIHKVQSGENFGTIAKRYGLTPGELEAFQAGALKDRGDLKVGQELVIWRDGAIAPGFGGEYEDEGGVLKAGVQLAAGSRYIVKTPSNAWGTAKTIRLIQTAVSTYGRRVAKGPDVHVGDISRKGGGKFPPHRSHQLGRDVDVGYVLSGAVADETRFLSANKSNLDAKKTWELIKAFIDTDEVRYIFMDYNVQKLVYEAAKESGVSQDTLDELFQYPRGKGRSHGLIRHWRNHVNHFHVRFRD